MNTDSKVQKIYDVVIASDHAGYALKLQLIKFLQDKGIRVTDMGTDSEESCDYPIFANKLVDRIDEGARGVLICGSGIGMSISANRHRRIRAALCRSLDDTQLSREHNNANVLVLGANFSSVDLAEKMLSCFLETDFLGGKHQRRLEMLS